MVLKHFQTFSHPKIDHVIRTSPLEISWPPAYKRDQNLRRLWILASLPYNGVQKFGGSNNKQDAYNNNNNNLFNLHVGWRGGHEVIMVSPQFYSFGFQFVNI